MGPCVREERKIAEIPWGGREILLPAAFLWWSRSERNDVFLRGERYALHRENWAAAAIRPANGLPAKVGISAAGYRYRLEKK